MRFLLLLCLTASAAHAIPTVVRPDFENVNRPDQAAGSPVISVNGGVFSTNPPAVGMNVLSEYSIGQNFTPFASPYETDSESFADDVLINGRTVTTFTEVDGIVTTTVTTIPGVFGVLYPTGFGTSGGISIANSDLTDPELGGVFRYRWLMYGPEPEPDGGEPGFTPAIINLFGSQGNDDSAWFTDADRAAAIVQIDVLREALALAPLNNRLQSALLDIYYDLAVAEMQLVRRSLGQLGRIRLGLNPPTVDDGDGGRETTPFIIDAEIEIYEKMVARTAQVLKLYGELFTFPMEGFNPSDLFSGTIASSGLDPSEGAPFGYFLFQNQVPLRSQVASEFISSDTDEVVNILDPADAANVFQGYKDYRSLLTILGQYIQFQADLSRYRAMRRADTPSGNDITLARDGLQAAQEATAIATSLNRMFSDVDFDDVALDDTGVRAAKEAVDVATNSTTEVRNFVNGIANVLGLDPNFLILYPAEGELFDSYDILDDTITRRSNGLATGPLVIALDALNGTTGKIGAAEAYDTFRESVDRVQSELGDLDQNYAARFAEITGYDYENEFADWDGTHPKPGTASELTRVTETIASLTRQKNNLRTLAAQRSLDIAETDRAVSLATGIAASVREADATYLSQSSSAWKEIQVQGGLSAGSQAVTDGLLTGVGLENPLSAAPKLAVIAGSTAYNTAIQTMSAVRTSEREQELEKLAIQRETKIFEAELPLLVQEARLALGELQREATAHTLEVEDNLANIIQALSERDSLLREIERELSNLRGNRDDLATAYFADPIHFIRSENAVLDADAAFRTAQRWTFYTLRALEHKWNERFAFADPGDVALGRSFDTNTIFSARNANELELVRQKMAAFDLRRINTISAPTTSVISLKNHVLSRNPDDPDLTFNLLQFPDQGVRASSNGGVVDQLTHFRERLESFRTNGNNFSIPLDTTLLSNIDTTFFTGPNFSNLDNPESGNYRNKIEWTAVNIVADDAPIPSNTAGKGGRIIYGGNTMFRTRIPICPDRTPGTDFDPEKDFTSEYIVQPFRFFQEPDFNGFVAFDRQNVGTYKMAYSGASWDDSSAVRNSITSADLGQSGFRRGDLKERSVAATRWSIEINNIDINQITDIELIISHVFSPRAQITCDPQ